MVSISVQQSLSLALDRRIPMEALVLNRLAKIPMTRQSDWLRGLLVAGFIVECQVLKAGLRDQVRSTYEEANLSNHPGQARTAYSRWLAASRFTQKQPALKRTVPDVVKIPATRELLPNTQKPFADLRKVIG